MKFLKKKNSESAETAAADRAPDTAANTGKNETREKRAQGIGVRGNSLRTAWLLGAALIVLGVVLLVTFLFMLREPGEQRAVLRQVSVNYAAERAQAIGAAVAGLQQRVVAAAASPVALDAIASDDAGAVVAAEAALQAFFPEALSLRLLSLGEMGTTDLDSGDELRNHIEVDLVRRAGSGNEPRPEAYQYEGQWLLSIAAAGTHPDITARRAVLLVTLPQEQLGTWLAGTGDLAGQYLLRQRFNASSGGSSDIDVMSRGSGVDEGMETASVPGSDWKVVFRPGAELLEEVRGIGRGDFDLILLLGALALAASVLIWRRSDAALAKDIKQVMDSADQRKALDLGVPALAPMARELRKLALRGSRGGAERSPGAEPAPRGTGGAGLGAVDGPSVTELPAHIFRAYDIRGIADSELTDEVIYRIGSAIGTLAAEMEEQTIVLGHDGRHSSDRIRDVIEEALLATGRNVVNIGLVPTPLLYYATHRLGAESGIMVTGSHNPAQYNGLKVVLKRAALAQGTIERVRDLAESGEFVKGSGTASHEDVLGSYLDEIAGDIAMAVPLKIVVDAGNGTAGTVAPALLEELGCEVLRLHCEVDGSFPNHGPDTGNDDNLQDLVREVKASGSDFGVAYDGDGDRLAVVTNEGDILRTDTLMMVFARDIVARNPGADVVYDVKCSRILAQLINSLGGRPVLSKTGHAFMKQKMMETGALLGGEFSGHVFFGERWYGFDDGIYATCRLAEIISSHEHELDEMVSDLPKMVSTPEILVPVPEDEKFGLIERFVNGARFEGGKTNDLDGLRVDFEAGWGLLRASNTSPSLTARFEANNEVELQRIMGLFRQQLSSVAPDLDIPF